MPEAFFCDLLDYVRVGTKSSPMKATTISAWWKSVLVPEFSIGGCEEKLQRSYLSDRRWNGKWSNSAVSSLGGWTQAIYRTKQSTSNLITSKGPFIVAPLNIWLWHQDHGQWPNMQSRKTRHSLNTNLNINIRVYDNLWYVIIPKGDNSVPGTVKCKAISYCLNKICKKIIISNASHEIKSTISLHVPCHV